MKLSYTIMDFANVSENIDIIGDYDPEDNTFDPTSAIVRKGPRSMDMIELFKYAGIIDTLIENVDFREIYANQFKYA